jgi:hypothetical protein
METVRGSKGEKARNVHDGALHRNKAFHPKALEILGLFLSRREEAGSQMGVHLGVSEGKGAKVEGRSVFDENWTEQWRDWLTTIPLRAA